MAADKLGKVIEALAKQGIVVSDDTTEENFLDHLYQSLLTANAADDDDDDIADTSVADPGIAMSLNGRIAGQLDQLVREGRATQAEAKRMGLGKPADAAMFIENRRAVPAGTFHIDERDPAKVKATADWALGGPKPQ